MLKRVTALAAAILLPLPALANSGHVIQVHRGGDCVEFAILEDAAAICGSNNVYQSSGTVNPACLAAVPWYAIATGQGAGQTELTIGQLPFFIAAASAIDTAFHETQAVAGILDVQEGEGFGVPAGELTLLEGPGSALGFTITGSLTCKNIDAQAGTHTVNAVANLNTPPGPYQ